MRSTSTKLKTFEHSGSRKVRELHDQMATLISVVNSRYRPLNNKIIGGEDKKAPRPLCATNWDYTYEIGTYTYEIGPFHLICGWRWKELHGGCDHISVIGSIRGDEGGALQDIF